MSTWSGFAHLEATAEAVAEVFFAHQEPAPAATPDGRTHRIGALTRPRNNRRRTSACMAEVRRRQFFRSTHHHITQAQGTSDAEARRHRAGPLTVHGHGS